MSENIKTKAELVALMREKQTDAHMNRSISWLAYRECADALEALPEPVPPDAETLARHIASAGGIAEDWARQVRALGAHIAELETWRERDDNEWKRRAEQAEALSAAVERRLNGEWHVAGIDAFIRDLRAALAAPVPSVEG